MIRYILLTLLLIAAPCHASILVMSTNGTYTQKATLAAAVADADTVGKTVIVTHALSAVQSNISSATVHNWPTNRTLQVVSGGSIGNTTKFVFNDSVLRPVEWWGVTTAAVNKAVAASSITFTGAAYALDGDIRIPANRKIYVSPRTVITNTGGRFSALDVDNVDIEVDGWIKSVNMATAPGKTAWLHIPSNPGDDRGFIEFGSTVPGTVKSNFTVHGHGTISGDWTGTPNFDEENWVRMLNRKGIGSWLARNVIIRDLQVFGFEGEAVFAWSTDSNSVNVLFENLYSHDNQHDNLNFNVLNAYRGWKMKNNLTEGGLVGIEMSSGEATGNQVFTPVSNGIMTGGGGGAGPITITNNLVYGAGEVSFYAWFTGSTVSPVVVDNNQAYNSGQNAFLVDLVERFSLRNNLSIGHAQSSIGYAFNIGHSVSGVVEGNLSRLPGTHTQGDFYGSETAAGNTGVYFDTGVFTPTLTGLTIGTDESYTGTFTRRGNRVFCTVHIFANTSASTYGDTWITGLPYTVAEDDTATTAYIGGSLGTTLVQASGQKVFTPTWSASNNVFTVSFSYLTTE